MMVDPAMIVEYAGPIVVITLAVILGAIPLRDAGCAAGRATAEDGYAMRFQSDANR